MAGPGSIARAMHVGVALALAACDCGRSHERMADAALETDAPVNRDALADAPRYDTALACDDPALWSRVPTRSAMLEEPFECVDFHEPLHAFRLYAGPAEPTGVWCWTTVAIDEAAGLNVGDVFETADPSFEAYLVPAGDAPTVTFEARLQSSDGSLVAGTGTYSARRMSSAGIEEERAAGRPFVLRRGHATATGGDLAPDVPVVATMLLGAVDFGHSAPGVAWIDRRASGLSLGIAARDYVADAYRTFEVPVDETPGTMPLLAGSSRSDDAAVAVVSGTRATVVLVDFGSPTTSPTIETRTFELGMAPEAIALWQGHVLGNAGGALVAWTLSGDARPASVDALSAIVPGSRQPWLVASGEIGPPELDATGAITRGAGYLVDSTIGRPIAAGDDVLIGESGFQRPPLDAGPSTVRSDDLFGGGVVGAIVDDYYGRWRFAVSRDDGTYAIYGTEPSFEGCD